MSSCSLNESHLTQYIYNKAVTRLGHSLPWWSLIQWCDSDGCYEMFSWQVFASFFLIRHPDVVPHSITRKMTGNCQKEETGLMTSHDHGYFWWMAKSQQPKLFSNAPFVLWKLSFKILYYLWYLLSNTSHPEVDHPTRSGKLFQNNFQEFSAGLSMHEIIFLFRGKSLKTVRTLWHCALFLSLACFQSLLALVRAIHD